MLASCRVANGVSFSYPWPSMHKLYSCKMHTQYTLVLWVNTLRHSMREFIFDWLGHLKWRLAIKRSLQYTQQSVQVKTLCEMSCSLSKRKVLTHCNEFAGWIENTSTFGESIDDECDRQGVKSRMIQSRILYTRCTRWMTDVNMSCNFNWTFVLTYTSAPLLPWL